MIKLNRGAAPHSLTSPRIQKAKKELWMQYESGTQRRFAVRQEFLRPIKEELYELSGHKCAYCESKGIASSLWIDHFRPRSGCVDDAKRLLPNHYFWLAYEWENLLLACPACGSAKRDSFPLQNEKYRARIGADFSELAFEKPMLIDPFRDIPEDHFFFKESGELVPKTDRGRFTIALVGLNRGPLVDARKRAVEIFSARLSAGSVLQWEIEELFSTRSNQEYAAFLRSVYQSYKQSDTHGQVKARSMISYRRMESNRSSSPTKKVLQLLENYKQVERFTIKSIEIKNFRSIKHLRLSFPETDASMETESWILFLGDNGVGKTSILQAIAIALCGKEQFDKLNLDVREYLKSKSKTGFIKLSSYERTEDILVSFSEAGFEGISTDPLPMLIGYGATRLLPKKDLPYSEPINKQVNIDNLFSYSSPLNDAHSWLQGIGKKEFDTKVAPALFDLLDLKDNERVLRGKDGKLKVKYANGSFDLEKTSDGYQAIIALACDIMKTLSVNPSGYHNANGIVLIDELGNHLHPRWRMKIAQALRLTFPKLQFIVTTHEPLCLRGLLKNEVTVLLSDANREVFAIDHQLLPDHTLMRVDELLTSDFFGLINIFDRNTQIKFDEYYKLLSIPKSERSADEVDKIQVLNRFFAAHEMPGSSPRAQAVYQIINEEFSSKLIESDFKAKSVLKKETIAEVRSILKLEEKDWL